MPDRGVCDKNKENRTQRQRSLSDTTETGEASSEEEAKIQAAGGPIGFEPVDEVEDQDFGAAEPEELAEETGSTAEETEEAAETEH